MHKTVLLKTAIDYLNVQPNNWYVDATFGAGGHTGEILSRGGKVLALDIDDQAIQAGQVKFLNEIRDTRLILVRENFSQLERILSSNLEYLISGILFDFGTSTDQLMSDDRGFSFDSDSELDMRMDDRLGVKAKDLLAVLNGPQLMDMFWEMGGEEQSRRIAKTIVDVRQKQPITTARQLANLVTQIKGGRHGHLHPATKVFQALRIVVNGELDAIKDGLPQAIEILQPGGRLVTIAFHEGEDRIVKHLMEAWEQEHLGEKITKKPIQPDETELSANPRSRSAKLRVFEKK
jgi:16S rRNA (cytosine1402-N4)-methyltransferase